LIAAIFSASVFGLLRNKYLLYQIVSDVFIGIENGLFMGVLPASYAFTNAIDFGSVGIFLAGYAFSCGVGQIGGMFLHDYCSLPTAASFTTIVKL
jgi:hypothetical protein